MNNGSQYVAYNSSTNLKLQSAAYNFTITEPYNNDTFQVAATANTSRGIIFRAKTYNQFGGYATSNLSETGKEYYTMGEGRHRLLPLSLPPFGAFYLMENANLKKIKI